jgi:hypothetical protein
LCSSDAPLSSGRFMMSRIALSCHRQTPNAIRNTTMQAISRLRSSSRVIDQAQPILVPDRPKGARHRERA